VQTGNAIHTVCMLLPATLHTGIIVGGLALMLCLAACAVGPDYRRPPVQLPETFKEGVDWRRAQANPRDLVAADRHDTAAYLDDTTTHLIGVGVARDQAAGEWIGLMHSSARGTEVLREELAAMQAEGTLPQADLLTVIDRLRARCAVAVHYIAGHWLDVDTLTDLADARNFS